MPIVETLKQIDVDSSEWIKTWGGYNDQPPNLKELTELDFARSDYFVYTWKKREFRQFKIPNLDNKVEYHSVYLFYMPHGHGYAITRDYWAGKVRYFRFGCLHKWVELDKKECTEQNIPHFGNCYHVYRCLNCGIVTAQDSSG